MSWLSTPRRFPRNILWQENHHGWSAHRQKFAGKLRHSIGLKAEESDAVGPQIQRIKELAAGIDGQAARMFAFGRGGCELGGGSIRAHRESGDGIVGTVGGIDILAAGRDQKARCRSAPLITVRQGRDAPALWR